GSAGRFNRKRLLHVAIAVGVLVMCLARRQQRQRVLDSMLCRRVAYCHSQRNRPPVSAVTSGREITWRKRLCSAACRRGTASPRIVWPKLGLAAAPILSRANEIFCLRSLRILSRKNLCGN